MSYIFKRSLFLSSLLALALSGCAMPNTAVSTATAPTASQVAQTLANQRTMQYQMCLIYYGSKDIIAQKLLTLPKSQATLLYQATVQATNGCNTVLTNTSQGVTLLGSAFATIAAQAGIDFTIPPTTTAPTASTVS